MKNISSSTIRFISAAAAAFFVAACAGTSTDGSSGTLADDVSTASVEVVHGIADRGRDPAVVAIDIAGEALCSGTLVAPNVVLTARHCVSETTEEVQCPADGQQITGNRTASSLTVLSGDDAESAQELAKGKKIVTPASTVLCDEDIALIVLDRDVTGITPLVVRSTGATTGEHLRLVGYGKSGDDSGAGEKLLRTNVPVVSVTAHEFQTAEATCNGDSGGPAIDESSGEIVGVVSRGGPTCEGSDTRNIFTRTDAFAALIDSATGATSPAPAKSPANTGKTPSGDMGAECTSGSQCSAGVCLAAGGDTYCSRMCDSSNHCPTGYGCKAAKSGHHVCVQH
ncbi:MAG: S1 family peptidase [Polyangiaceae bacterium]